MSDTVADITDMSDADTLVQEIETWLTATVNRDLLNTKDIRELQNLLLDVHTRLVAPEPN